MDCVVPGHSVRPFCASIGCLSRIGKDLYVEFDAIEGLHFRTLNDAKSAYACFRFEPSFFERCTAPPLESTTTTRKRRSRTTEEPSQELRFSCRVSLRALAAVVRPRRAVAALRVRSEVSSSVFFLSFEFQLRNNDEDALLTVVHRMKVAEANSVSASAPKDGASEIVASPRVLLRLLEPLKRTALAALVVRSAAQTVSASSFHHTDTTMPDSNAANQNAILQATSASLLKSETAIGCDEFEEFDFREDRKVGDGDDSLPDGVNSEVVLVFPIKEAKSLLQFSSQANLDQELSVSVFFHWGGKPMVLETSTDSFSAHVVLATLNHELLTSLRTDTAGAEAVNRAANQ